MFQNPVLHNTYLSSENNIVGARGPADPTPPFIRVFGLKWLAQPRCASGTPKTTLKVDNADYCSWTDPRQKPWCVTGLCALTHVERSALHVLLLVCAIVGYCLTCDCYGRAEIFVLTSTTARGNATCNRRPSLLRDILSRSTIERRERQRQSLRNAEGAQ